LVELKGRTLVGLAHGGTEALVVEAVERLVSYDEWFLREVQKGLAAADRGELVDHDEVRKLIDERYPG
jgi:predicted transcriptional regulator